MEAGSNPVNNSSLSSTGNASTLDASKVINQLESSVQEKVKPYSESSLASSNSMGAPEESKAESESLQSVPGNVSAHKDVIDDSEADGQVDSSVHEETKPDNISPGDLGPSCDLASSPAIKKIRSLSLTHESPSKIIPDHGRKHKSVKSTSSMSSITGAIRKLWARQTISVSSKRNSPGGYTSSPELIDSKSAVIYPQVKGFPFQIIVKQDNRK